MSRNPKQSPLAPSTPAFDEPVLDLGPSEFELFWDQHKSKVLIGIGAVLVAVIGFFAAMAITHANRVAATEAFAAAKTPEALREVIAKHPSSPEAGNASLLLAAALRDEKKPDEARTVLDAFLKSQPKHPLAPLALISLANIATEAGDVKQAIADYQSVASQYPESFAVPFAQLSEAQLALANGDRKAALAGFQSLSRQHPASISAGAGKSTLVALEALNLGDPTPVASPTPAETPAP
jgi:tetratricopeptide (TPR) repeat protein